MGDVRDQERLKARTMELASVFCHSATATLCVSVDLCCESYLVLFIPTQSFKMSSNMSISTAKTKHLGKNRSHYRLCVPPYKRCISAGDTHSLCVVCLGAKHAESVLERAGCLHCERLLRCALRLCSAIFAERAFARIPRGAGPAAGEAERRLHSWGLQMDQVERMKTGEPLSFPYPIRSNTRSLGSKAAL